MVCGSSTCKGPGWATPLDAFQNAPHEKLLYICCIRKPCKDGDSKPLPDYLAVVDVDPESSRYCEVIGRCECPNVEDELHHTGWKCM